MRGPLLSGPLGSTACLEALVRWLGGASSSTPPAPAVLLGPLWLGETLSQALPILMLVEGDDRPGVKRVRRRTSRASRPFAVALAGAELPLRPRTIGALVIENVAGLDTDAAHKWLHALVPLLRPGARLIAADATSSPTAMARVVGAFLSASLVDLCQEQPREGVVLTVGRAPSAPIMAARFGPPAIETRA